MPIVLTPELEKLVDEEIESGDFDSPNEVLLEGLLMLKNRRTSKPVRLQNLRREIQKGIDAKKEGRFTLYDSADELIEDVIKEARIEFEARKKNGA